MMKLTLLLCMELRHGNEDSLYKQSRSRTIFEVKMTNPPFSVRPVLFHFLMMCVSRWVYVDQQYLRFLSNNKTRGPVHTYVRDGVLRRKIYVAELFFVCQSASMFVCRGQQNFESLHSNGQQRSSSKKPRQTSTGPAIVIGKILVLLFINDYDPHVLNWQIYKLLTYFLIQQNCSLESFQSNKIVDLTVCGFSTMYFIYNSVILLTLE
jgi:hypothetical protein